MKKRHLRHALKVMKRLLAQTEDSLIERTNELQAVRAERDSWKGRAERAEESACELARASQKASTPRPFKDGDRVLIAKPDPSTESAKDWLAAMDHLDGRVGTVSRVYSTTKPGDPEQRIFVDDISWFFRPEWLTLIDDPASRHVVAHLPAVGGKGECDASCAACAARKIP